MSGVLWVIVAVVVVVGIVIALLGWDRYGGHRPGVSSNASQPTNEVFIDPATGAQTRVWYNPTTGEREYRSEGR
jgi:hypothetical protein